MESGANTDARLANEISRLRERIAELEAKEAEYRQAETPLGGSIVDYRDLYENAPDMFASVDDRYAGAERLAGFGHWQRDMISGIASWSQGTYRILGLDPDESEPTFESFFSLVHPEDRPRVQSAMEGVSEDCPSFDMEFLITRTDREERAISTVATGRFDGTGRLTSISGFVHDITERTKAEEALNLYPEIVRNIAEGVTLFHDSDGVLLYANPQFETMFGYEPGELIGEHVSILNASEKKSPKRRVAEIGSGLGERGKWVGEIQNVKKDGTVFWTSAHISGFDHPDFGRVWVSVQEDITKRKQTEAALSDERRLLETISNTQSKYINEPDPRLLFETLLEDICSITGSEYGFIGQVLTSPDGSRYLRTQAITDISWNEETRKLVQEKSEEGMEFFNLDTLFGVVLRTGEPVISNSPRDDPRRGGLPEDHPPLNAFLGLPFHDGEKLIGMAGLANRPGGYDQKIIQYLEPFSATCTQIITAYRRDYDRDRAEAALKASEHQLRVMSDNMPALIANIGSDRRYLFVNKAYQEFMGLPSDQIIGKTLSEVLGRENYARFKDDIDKALSGEEVSVEHEFGKDGDDIRWLWANYVPDIRDGDQVQGFFALVADVTERKRAEEERLQLEAQVQHAQKLESLGVLAGGIAHDFNNILVGVVGFTEIALADLPEESPVRESILEIQISARRATELARQMLAYSGRGKFVVKPVDISVLVDETAQLLKSSISKMAALECVLDRDLPAVDADVTQLRQVVMNLITNASDALGDESGVIRVTTGARVCDRAYLEKAHFEEELPEGDYVFLEVADTGCGMDSETTSRIFEPFFTTKFTGRGLGLAAVSGIVRGHHGAIKIESQSGRGTNFTILFPASTKPAKTLERKKSTPTNLPGDCTVLVVDDEASVRKVSRVVLERMGYKVLLAQDGQAGLEMFQAHQDEIGVVILDLTMPRMGGEETYERMAQIKSSVPVILSSGYDQQESVARFSGKGFSGFLKKPYLKADLVARLREAVAPVPRND